MKKQVKAHMLPTEDEVDLFINTYILPANGSKSLNHKEDISNGINNNTSELSDRGYVAHHIYITSDDEIKEGDWFIWHDSEEPELFKCMGLTETTHLRVQNSLNITILGTYLKHPNESEYGDWAKCYSRKIIATSDILLIKDDGYTDHIPNVSQSFLKAFVESGNKEDWEVEIEGNVCNCIVHEESEGCFHCDYTGIDYYKLKLDSDNCVILNAVETCEHPFKRLHWVGTKVYCNKCNTTLVKPVEEKMYTFLKLKEACVYFAYTTYPWTTQEVDDWIKENL